MRQIKARHPPGAGSCSGKGLNLLWALLASWALITLSTSTTSAAAEASKEDADDLLQPLEASGGDLILVSNATSDDGNGTTTLNDTGTPDGSGPPYYNGDEFLPDLTDDTLESTDEGDDHLPERTTAKHGYCSDGVHPAHGPDGAGCCASAEFGCCPDLKSAATGPSFEGCPLGDDSGEVDHPRGCHDSRNGCCPDSVTEASGKDFEGCPCETFRHGCCLDGSTAAQGPNRQGCPARSASCEADDEELCRSCAESRHGCCLDGVTAATGPDFRDCPGHVPIGQRCGHPTRAGPCSDFTPKWFYDAQYGGCNRFWYGGCDPGPNHFEDEESCRNACVSPRDSAVCHLQKNAGSCDGKYDEWYFDPGRQACLPFVYSGCLGNGNRFLDRAECEATCLEPREDLDACLAPRREGPCAGDYPRWFYAPDLGECRQFSYSGCGGNGNRFLSRSDCTRACAHRTLQRLREVVCRKPIDPGPPCQGDGGQVHLLLPRWGYDSKVFRNCVPFYFDIAGCRDLAGHDDYEDPNSNRFLTEEECRKSCPRLYPPTIELPQGEEIFVRRGAVDAVLAVRIRANPEANVTWYHVGRAISPRFDDRYYAVLPDHSLLLKRASDYDSGPYTIRAANGVGASAQERQIRVVVYPLRPEAAVEMERNLFSSGDDVRIPCSVTGYPPPQVSWYKSRSAAGRPSYGRRGPSGRGAVVEPDGRKVRIEAHQVERTKTVSTLVMYGVVAGLDSGTYTCVAESEGSAEGSTPWSSSASVRITVQQESAGGDKGTACQDRPSYSHCDKVVRHRFCGSRYYGRYCCRSCTDAGMAPGGLASLASLKSDNDS